MTDLANQSFIDVRPILMDYKEAAAKRHSTIENEFFRREQIARAVPPPPHHTNPPITTTTTIPIPINC
jgi:hypothetical protein